MVRLFAKLPETDEKMIFQRNVDMPVIDFLGNAFSFYASKGNP